MNQEQKNFNEKVNNLQTSSQSNIVNRPQQLNNQVGPQNPVNQFASQANMSSGLNQPVNSVNPQNPVNQFTGQSNISGGLNQQLNPINAQNPVNQFTSSFNMSNNSNQTINPVSSQNLVDKVTNQGNMNNSKDSKSSKTSDNNGMFIKKNLKWIIIGGAVGLVSLVLIISLVFGENRGSLIGRSGNKITVNEISKYNLEKDTVWINKPLGITYELPKIIGGSFRNGSPSFTYMHGSYTEYYKGYKIYVDKSLEGHQNLETLASDIIAEKKSDKYNIIYNFGTVGLSQFDNEKTEKVKIAKIDAVYFESKPLVIEGAMVNELQIKIVGYNFKYNDQYISVYGEFLINEESNLDDLKHRLQYIISTIKPFDGKSIQELGGNVKEYYDDGYNNKYLEATTKITINHISDHQLNSYIGIDHYDIVEELDPNYIEWNGTLDDIFAATQKSKIAYDDIYEKEVPYYKNTFDWLDYDDVNGTWVNEENIKILKEENVTINDIDMKRYVIKTDAYYIVVYTFILDGKPYVFSYHLDIWVYDDEVTEEQANVYMAQTEAVADSFIYTITKIGNEEYSNYITRFGL